MKRAGDFFAVIFCTVFYTGYLPLIPGTFGSLAGLLVFFLVKNNPALYVLAILLTLILGFWLSGEVERIKNRKDPSCVVIDEVCGMLLSLAFIPPQPKYILLAFFLFRLLDTLKPFPADRLQRLKGGSGIMIDDIIAGLYTNLILQAVLRLNSLSGA